MYMDAWMHVCMHACMHVYIYNTHQYILMNSEERSPISWMSPSIFLSEITFGTAPAGRDEFSHGNITQITQILDQIQSSKGEYSYPPKSPIQNRIICRHLQFSSYCVEYAFASVV